MAVRNIVAAIAALAASAGAGGAYFATSTPATPAPSPHTTVVLETKEAPAEQEQSVKVESADKKQRVEVQQARSGSAVRVQGGDKASKVEVKSTKSGDQDVSAGNVKVQRKGKGVSLKVGDLVVDTNSLGQ
ncbi:MAG: hypothetical protein IPM35_05790 [Myxococcales bacterium]|nr:hypothetical protein [Myxococcales bacterium]